MNPLTWLANTIGNHIDAAICHWPNTTDDHAGDEPRGNR